MRELRNLYKTVGPNDGNRSLVESTLVPAVVDAIENWSQSNTVDGVLIGSLALSYWVKPRVTQDLEYLFMDRNHFPASVVGFKRVGPHAFLHDQTRVEIKVLDPEFLKIPDAMAQKVRRTAVLSSGVKIASPEGLVVLKLQTWTRQDQADIEALKEIRPPMSVSDWYLTTEQLQRFDSI